jgi:hypothetical protein
MDILSYRKVKIAIFISCAIKRLSKDATSRFVKKITEY